MQASIEIRSNGKVTLHLDEEAARAVFASVLFAAQFHERIAPLTKVAIEGMRCEGQTAVRRSALCQ